MKHEKGFSQYLKIEKGRSDKTIAAYLGDISRFRIHLDENPEEGLVLGWEDVQTKHIRAYLSELDASPAYFRRVHSSLKVWFDYLHSVAEVVPSNPTLTISKPKKAQHHPKVLSVLEVRKLIESAVEESRQSERLRNWTLIAFLVNTGLRVSELCDLNDSSVKYRDGLPHSVTVIGKGNKERTVVLSDNAQTSLHQWLRYRKQLLADLPPGSDRDAIWIIPAGPRLGKRLSPAAVRKLLKRFGNFANIQKTVHPHKLRHTFATEAVRGGAKLHALRDALGHARLDTMGIYLHADETELEAVAAVLPDVLGNSKKKKLSEELPDEKLLSGI